MMKNAYRRIRVATTLMAAASLLVPADAQAFLGLCQKRQNAAAALYGGTVCNPCGQQLVVNYVPQTCYRTQTVQVPVTTYRPVCSADPCTGCQTTVMRPVVNYQQQVQYVPYSSYRLQYSIAQPACPTATTSYYAPAPTSGIGAPATTYAAPAATYAAPTSGCSSCNSGAATTSYYAPAPAYAGTGYPVTTNYAAPRLLAPTTALPRATNVYSYPTTPGNVNVGGYNYATPGASGIAPSSNYGSSSFTPAYSAPSASSPSYASPTYSAPMSANPATAIPTYSSPSYASPTYSTPVPSLNGSSVSGSTLNGTTLSLAPPPTSSSATAGSAYYTPSTGSYSTGSYPAGAMVPVPGTMSPTLASPSTSIPPTTTYSNPVPTLSTPSTSSPILTLPGTTTAPARLPYSSGVAPSGTTTPAAPMQQPIPDVEINRGLRMGPTSTPALIDPEDKTAMAWPARRAWDYRVVGNVMPASYTAVATQEATVQPAVAQEAVAPSTMPQLSAQPTFAHTEVAAPSAMARLGAPREAMEIEVMYAPHQPSVQQPSRPQVDRDGWSSASR